MDGRRSITVSRRWGRAVPLAAMAMSFVLVAPLAAEASVSPVSDATARVNGTVYAVAQLGTRTIIGGDFTTVGGLPRHNLAVLDARGKVDPTFVSDVNGVVLAVAGSADGSTVYAGGTFTEAGGAPRANVAAVDATGAALPAWTADTVGDAPDVLGLAVSDSKLYVAGRFAGIDGTTRRRLVALDAAGNVITGFRPAPTGTVRVVAPSADGTRVFAGGSFGLIGGQTRAGVAELDPATGAARPFAVQPTGSLLTALGISPNGDRLYYGVGDNRVFAYDTNTTGAPLWTVKNGGDTQAIAAGATEVYLGGHFGNNLTAKVKRQWIESVSADTGAVTAWDPQMAGGFMGVWAITATPTGLLVGGGFTTVGGVDRRRFAAFSGTP